MFGDLLDVLPVLIFGCAEKPFACLRMGSLDSGVASIDLIKPQGIEVASAVVGVESRRHTSRGESRGSL